MSQPSYTLERLGDILVVVSIPIERKMSKQEDFVGLVPADYDFEKVFGAFLTSRGANGTQTGCLGFAQSFTKNDDTALYGGAVQFRIAFRERDNISKLYQCLGEICQKLGLTSLFIEENGHPFRLNVIPIKNKY